MEYVGDVSVEDVVEEVGELFYLLGYGVGEGEVGGEGRRKVTSVRIMPPSEW